MKNAPIQSNIRFKIEKKESMNNKENPQIQFDYQLLKAYINLNDIESFFTSLQVSFPQVTNSRLIYIRYIKNILNSVLQFIKAGYCC